MFTKAMGTAVKATRPNRRAPSAVARTGSHPAPPLTGRIDWVGAASRAELLHRQLLNPLTHRAYPVGQWIVRTHASEAHPRQVA